LDADHPPDPTPQLVIATLNVEDDPNRLGVYGFRPPGAVVGERVARHEPSALVIRFSGERITQAWGEPELVGEAAGATRSPAEHHPPGSTGLKFHPGEGASHVPNPRVGNTNRQRRAQPSHPPRRGRAKERVRGVTPTIRIRSEEHTAELQSRENLRCRLI